MPRSKLRSIWFWARATLEVCALTWGGGVISFYAFGLLGVVQSPHGTAAAIAVLIGMGSGLALSLLIVLKRAMRTRSEDRDA